METLEKMSSSPALAATHDFDNSAQLASYVARAYAKRTPLRIEGGGSKRFYGAHDDYEPLDTTAHRGIVSYEASELVVTARAGTPLAELETLLHANAQMLAFEPPHFGAATVGGCVACGLSGPRRMASGSVRDFVLGARLLDGRGQVLNFGGQVMKNVAGYDVSRVLAGSMGTLGVLLDVSLKVMPRPPASVTLVFEMDEAAAIDQLDRWAGKPLPITASAWCEGILRLRLESSATGVASARAVLGGSELDPTVSTRFWHDLKEHTLPFFLSDEPLWRIALPATTAHLASEGDQLIEWSGQERWLRSSEPAQRVRARAAQAGGHAILFRADAELRRSAGVFQTPTVGIGAIEERLRQQFDPGAIFNPGRVSVRPNAARIS